MSIRPVRHPRSRIAGIATLLIATACGGGGSTTGPPDNTVASVAIAPADSLLVPGQTLQLSASIRSSAGGTLSRTVTWSSAPTSIASVNSSGLVTGVAAGDAVITATVDNKSDTKQVTVFPGANLPTDEFILIQPGTFAMGAVGNAATLPVHQVTISRAFLLQKNEVTQAEWRGVMNRSPSFRTSCDDCPVEQVSWEDITIFLRVLNAANPGLNYRLPTEAEWEYAARAGTTGEYGGTGVLDQMGWYNGNSQYPGGGTGLQDGRTWPVRQKLANAWGIYDMHGNVWEWVNDWWSATYYSTSPTQDPPGPATGTTHVIRGGSWLNFALFATSAYRGPPDAGFERAKNLGFRVARTP